MGISIVQKTTTPAHTGNGASLTASFGSTVTAGNTVLVLAWGWSGTTTATVPTVKDSNNTSYTNDKYTFLSDDLWCGIWRLSNVGSGITSVTLTSGFQAGDITVVAVEVAGLVTSSPKDGSGTAATSSAGSTSPAPGSLTTANANDLLVAVMVDDGTGTITDPSGWTDEYDETNGSSYEQGSGMTQIVSATGSYNPTWTLGASAKWGSCQVAYKGSGTTSHLLCCLGCGG